MTAGCPMLGTLFVANAYYSMQSYNDATHVTWATVDGKGSSGQGARVFKAINAAAIFLHIVETIRCDLHIIHLRVTKLPITSPGHG